MNIIANIIPTFFSSLIIDRYAPIIMNLRYALMTWCDYRNVSQRGIYTWTLLQKYCQHYCNIFSSIIIDRYAPIYNELLFSSSRVISAINDTSVRPCVHALVSGWQKSVMSSQVHYNRCIPIYYQRRE